ncbi:hypothetical protein ZEAMMB73_Zm00001d028184 [Zea mays]|uniref:Uncharacterized protein n=1 Tax=Zea mays TaxID=4577 RepID=A0A1D6JSN7_MAIZE|nr:hypothetical protein ZEAMMB73_Zm00001d028184 [Zea mays]
MAPHSPLGIAPSLRVRHRAPPSPRMAATGVSRGWREYTGRVWHAAEELCLRILTSSAISLLFALLLHPPLNRKAQNSCFAKSSPPKSSKI